MPPESENSTPFTKARSQIIVALMGREGKGREGEVRVCLTRAVTHAAERETEEKDDRSRRPLDH